MKHSYIPSLDGARAVAILIVIASHYGLGFFVPGNFGVTLFFFISGYLITHLLFLELSEHDRVAVFDFYVRRFLRLAPALITTVVSVSLGYHLLVGPIPWGQFFAGIFYYTNYYTIAGGSIAMPIVPLWSLAIEEHYYIAFPAIFILFCRAPARFLLLLSIAAVACLIWRLFLVFGLHVSVTYTHIATDTRIDSILYGAILATLARTRGRIDALQHPLAIAVGTLGLLLTFAIRNDTFRETLRYSLQGLALLPIFYGLILSGPNAVREALESPIMVWIGKLSYSLYLWHEAVAHFVGGVVSGWVHYPIALALTFVAAALSYYVVETPFRRLRGHFRSRLPAAATALIVVAVAAPAILFPGPTRAAESCDEFDKLVATTPAPPTTAEKLRLYNRQLASVTTTDVDILLLGDSLAQYWDTKWLLPLRAFNMGVGSDQTQHALWRLQSSEWSRIRPTTVLIILGINNIYYKVQKPCATVLGLAQVIARAKELWPRSMISFLEITPAGKDFATADAERCEVNSAMAAMPGIITINIDKQITCSGKVPCENYTSDQVHFTKAGYDVIHNAVRAAGLM